MMAWYLLKGILQFAFKTEHSTEAVFQYIHRSTLNRFIFLCIHYLQLKLNWSSQVQRRTSGGKNPPKCVSSLCECLFGVRMLGACLSYLWLPVMNRDFLNMHLFSCKGFWDLLSIIIIYLHDGLIFFCFYFLLMMNLFMKLLFLSCFFCLLLVITGVWQLLLQRHLNILML